MPFLALELFFALIVIVFSVTQIIVPVIRGTQMFPLWNKERKAVDNSLREAAEQQELIRLQNELRRKREENESLRGAPIVDEATVSEATTVEVEPAVTEPIGEPIKSRKKTAPRKRQPRRGETAQPFVSE